MTGGSETVVLLHGIARTGKSLRRIENALQKSGYQTLPITYPSRQYDIEAIADYLAAHDLNPAFWQAAGKVHFITHSMGGLVARCYLERYPQDNIGRIVMMGPPHGGSPIADLLHKFPLYNWYYGPAGRDLTTQARQQDQTRPGYQTGIIAGSASWPYVIARHFIRGKSDGRVSVDQTKWPGMVDHITLPATHTFMMNRKDTRHQVLHFLRHGRFDQG